MIEATIGIAVFSDDRALGLGLAFIAWETLTHAGAGWTGLQ